MTESPITFVRADDEPSAWSGTSLQGSIVENYQTLVEVFGEPTAGDGYKVDAEWVIRTNGGVCITIYNWKNGIAYGEQCLPVEDITDWHIGGRVGTNAADIVQRLIEDHMARLIEDSLGR